MEDAFPVVQSSGPLVLRLRSAIIGVDVGPAIPADQKDDKSLERAINIGKVGVEMEFVDSETGQQIAAAVDRKTLGEGAMVELGRLYPRGEVPGGHSKRSMAGPSGSGISWIRLQELSKEDIARTERTNFPYASRLLQ